MTEFVLQNLIEPETFERLEIVEQNIIFRLKITDMENGKHSMQKGYCTMFQCLSFNLILDVSTNC